jgi:hypothetical protein
MVWSARGQEICHIAATGGTSCMYIHFCQVPARISGHCIGSFQKEMAKRKYYIIYRYIIHRWASLFSPFANIYMYIHIYMLMNMYLYICIYIYGGKEVLFPGSENYKR